jgi:LPS-assembly protein
MAALFGAGALLSPVTARADPPPLLLPAPESAPVVPVTPPPSAPAPTTPAPAAPAGTSTTTKSFQFGKYSVAFDLGNVADATAGANPDNAVSVSGNVVLTSDTSNLTIHSDSYKVYPDKSFEVSGSVELTLEAMRVLTRKIDYDAQRVVMVADAVRMGKAPAYVDAATFSLSNGQADLTNATIFFGEPDPFGLNIRAPSATYHADTDEVVLHGATVRLGIVPIFYLPSYTQGRASQPPMSLQAHFGSRNDLGLYTQSTTFLTQNPEFSPGLLMDYYSKRGMLAGPAAKYDFTDNMDWWQDGTLESGFIHDTGNRGLDITGAPVPANRFFLDWQHQGTLAGVVDVTGTMSWWSDSNVLRDFRQGLWTNDQLPDNFVEASNRQENSLVSGFARFQPDDFEVVQERLPEVQYDYFPTPLGASGIYQEGDADYAQLIENNFNGTPTLHSNRLDGYYGWRRPINLGDAATITPVAGARITQYQDTLNDQGQFTRMLGQVGFDGELHLTGRWDYSNAAWGINGLQHVLRPVVSYRYIPAADQGQGLIPAIDSFVAPDYPPILDLGDTRNVDQLHSENVLRFGMENLLQTRAKDYGMRDLFSFNVYDDVHFENEAGAGEFSDVWTQVAVTPAPWLKFDAEDRVDPGAGANREVRTHTTISDGDRWSTTFTTDELQHSFDQYWLGVQYRVSERLSFYGRQDYDAQLGGLVEQTYGVRQRLGESWDVEYGISYFRGAGAQSGIGVNVRIYLLAK